MIYEKPSEIRARLQTLQNRIQAACQKAGRAATGVLLIGAAKTVSFEKLALFLEAGLENVGENYVQEGVSKIHELKRAGVLPRCEASFHLIGGLQSNKAREAVAHFDWIHSVDRVSLIKALDKAARDHEKTQKVLLQVNLGNEDSKSGCALQDVSTLATQIGERENLQLCGLMCLPPFQDEPENTRPHFRELRRLRDEVLGDETLQLSMGMSHDFEIAVQEGATMIRIGTALFGAR
jgi:pyridoxal phosphate enzyme (YggS family)